MEIIGAFLQGMEPGIGLVLVILAVSCASCVAGTMNKLWRRPGRYVVHLAVMTFFAVIGFITAVVFLVGVVVASPILAPHINGS